MVHRSTSYAKVDDGTFAVRVKIKIPELGPGKKSDELHRWLDQRLGRSGYALHGCGRLYVNDLEAAAECVKALGLELAVLPKQTP
jgi:hypothetical protein